MSADILVVVVLSILVTTIVVIIVDYRERSVWIGATHHQDVQQQNPPLLPPSPAAGANSGVELVTQRVSQSACDGTESTMHVVRIVSEDDARLGSKPSVYA